MGDGHLLSLREAADLLDVSRRTLFRLRQRGDFPPEIKAGHRTYFSRSEVLAWQTRQRNGESPAGPFAGIRPPTAPMLRGRHPSEGGSPVATRQPTWLDPSAPQVPPPEEPSDPNRFSGHLIFRDGAELDLTIDIRDDEIALIHAGQPLQSFRRRDVQFLRLTDERTRLSLAGKQADFFPVRSDEFVAALLRTRP